MEIFNNREVVIGFWIAVALVAVMASTKTRKAGYGVLKAFAHRLILIFLALMASYIGLVVYGLHTAGLWDVGQLKNTLIWSVTVAAVGLFRISSIIDDPHYFRHAIRDNFKLVAILEFIISFYTFSLLAEIIIVLVATFLVAVHAYAEEKQEHATVAKFFGNILAAAGVGLLVYTGYRIAADPDAFISRRTLSDFLLPPVLTLLYLPFLYVLAFYATYESVFTRLRFAIKNESFRFYAKRAAIAYYVEGDELTANRLKLQLGVDQSEESLEAHDKLVAAARRLCEKALRGNLPAEVEQALVAGQDTEVSLRGKKIILSRGSWPGHRFDGYTIRFIIRNDEEGAIRIGWTGL